MREMNKLKGFTKTILLAMVSKLAKSNKAEIAKAQKWIDNAQSQFTDALKNAELAEEKLDGMLVLKQEKLETLFAEMNEANAKKEQAVKFKHKIQHFIEN